MAVLSKLRLVAMNDVYELRNLPKVQTFLSQLNPSPSAVLVAGDFLSPSTLSAIDGGRGMVSTLRATGVTHCCFGNHEADLRLVPTLKERIEELSKSAVVINTNMRTSPPPGGDDNGARETSEWLRSPLTPAYSIVKSPCERVSIGLLGLLSDEVNMFRDGTFKGVPVDNVLDSYTEYRNALLMGNGNGEGPMVDMILPITHQSLTRDLDLARWMLQNHMPAFSSSSSSVGLIVGGHEHIPVDETVMLSHNNDNNDDDQDGSESYIRIVKSGTEAEHVSMIDMEFDVSSQPAQLTNVEYTLVPMSDYADSPVVKSIVSKHESVIRNLENEVIVNDTMVEHLFSSGEILSSERARLSQTTIGAFFCHAIKEELDVDVAILNGGPIKGETTYPDNTMTYAQLKKELPFPTKMVVVPMTRGELEDAIEYSHTHVEMGKKKEEGNENETNGTGSADGDVGTDPLPPKDLPRRGYLQVDFSFFLTLNTGDRDEVLQVALPRNLLSGFCQIQPLMDVGGRLKEQNRFPTDDDFVRALDLVTRHCCKYRWYQLTHVNTEFDDLDLNRDGVLDRYEIQKMMERFLGYKPEDFVVDDMIRSIDEDDNGVIDVGEFSYLLATMEREYSTRWGGSGGP